LQINRLLCEHASRERFASMFWAYFDPHRQELRYVNAGHCPPVLFPLRGSAPFRLTEGGPVLGLLPDARYVQDAVRMEPGDVLVLYSDGLVESVNSSGEPFGEERLETAVARHLGRSAEEIRDGVLAALKAFAGRTPADDDCTLVVACYQGAGVQRKPAQPEPSDELVAHAA
jgi:sigma-B regulation protein RsbU (phosphoserine phosphatase)